MNTTETLTAEITGARNHYGIPTAWVTPIETFNKYGERILIEEFSMEPTTGVIAAEGRKFTKAGAIQKRLYRNLDFYATPQNVVDVLEMIRANRGLR